VPSGELTDCVVDAVVQALSAEDLDGASFVDAAEALEATDRVEMAAASLRCLGMDRCRRAIGCQGAG
jgi:hypothetical protein